MRFLLGFIFTVPCLAPSLGSANTSCLFALNNTDLWLDATHLAQAALRRPEYAKAWNKPITDPLLISLSSVYAKTRSAHLALAAEAPAPTPALLPVRSLDFLSRYSLETQHELLVALQEISEQPRDWYEQKWGAGVNMKMLAEERIEKILLKNSLLQAAFLLKRINRDDLSILSRLILNLPISRGVILTSKIAARDSDVMTVDQFVQRLKAATQFSSTTLPDGKHSPFTLLSPPPVSPEVKLRDLISRLKPQAKVPAANPLHFPDGTSASANPFLPDVSPTAK